MSDWQIGDLAVCVDAVSHDGSGNAARVLREGASYRVLAVTGPHWWRGGSKQYGLVVGGAPHPGNALNGAWPEQRFRKITPDKHESCEEEFTVLLRRSKPKVRA